MSGAISVTRADSRPGPQHRRPPACPWRAAHSMSSKGSISPMGPEAFLADYRSATMRCWSAKFEYLFADFGRRGVVFPATAQRFESDLALHSLRVGLNYRLGDSAKADIFAGRGTPAADIFALHGQTTFVAQYAFPFRA